MKRVRAVSLLLLAHEGSHLLLVKRPQTDQELPGVWGLPAATVGEDETEMAAASRVGLEKLGVPVSLEGVVARGQQDRGAHTLEMALFLGLLTVEPVLPGSSGSQEDKTLYEAWRWDTGEALEEGLSKGSLCCRLALEFLKG
ncbi:MAG: NUDIX domain-containing protein [Chloroflexi bacterium]|nr:NUDIX domain-containing protein [Chloroflexota bacterium]